MKFRIVKDSMGSMEVPEHAKYGAQTQRAIENFQISHLTMPRSFIKAMGLIKHAAAKVNCELGLLDQERAQSIQHAADKVIEGQLDSQFPIDVFQTGSGTSTNMNTNEVIAQLASELGCDVHPNDHVNMSQSSNDVIPSAIHISACLEIHQSLIPALTHLANTLTQQSKQYADITKTGRTHLMDAMPITLGQELSGWAAQINQGLSRIQSSMPRLSALVIGGTAVGTGINAHPSFGLGMIEQLSTKTECTFTMSENRFEGMSAQDAAVEMSGQLKVIACSLMKIANDLRWMNSGPLAGFGEIALPALQPGSSIMPGKVNPVIPEAVAMACAQIMGNDLTVTIAGQSGNFQLNVMLPVIAHNLLESIQLATQSALHLADKALNGITINNDKIQSSLERNPILVTALNSTIGYELGAKIAKTAYEQQRPLIDVALEMTDLSKEMLTQLLDPKRLTQGGLPN